MTEKRLFRMTLGIVLWIFVVAPYMILLPSRPEGDLLIGIESRGVIPAGLERETALEEPKIHREKVFEEVDKTHARGRYEKTLDVLSATQSPLRVSTDALKLRVKDASTTTRQFHRGILVEGGRKSEIMLLLDSSQSQKTGGVEGVPKDEGSTLLEGMVRAQRKGSFKGITKILPLDLFEISQHWNETDFSGPSDVGDLISLLEGYRN